MNLHFKLITILAIDSFQCFCFPSKYFQSLFLCFCALKFNEKILELNFFECKKYFFSCFHNFLIHCHSNLLFSFVIFLIYYACIASSSFVYQFLFTRESAAFIRTLVLPANDRRRRLFSTFLTLFQLQKHSIKLVV